MKNVTVVIPALNEAAHIDGCIDSLRSNGKDLDALEILVVDGMSEDGTRGLVRAWAQEYPGRVRLIDNPGKITPKALNIGIWNASWERVMIASAHAAFGEAYLSTCLAELEKLNATGVGGIMETRARHDTPVTRALIRVLTDRVGVGNAVFRTGTDQPVEVDTVPFGVYDTETLKRIGGYDERLIRNQDIELSKRILRNGGRLFLTPKARCVYYIRETYSGVAANNFQNGYWNILVVYITRDLRSLGLRHFIPALFVMGLLLTFLGGFFEPLLWGIGGAVFLIYLLLITAASLRLRDPSTAFPRLLWGFLVLHFSYGVGSLAGLFRVDAMR